jgi:hypothetical protein
MRMCKEGKFFLSKSVKYYFKIFFSGSTFWEANNFEEIRKVKGTVS